MGQIYKNILITGGSGFIGSNFIHYLIEKSDANIFNLDKLTYAGNNANHIDIEHLKSYKFIEGDINDSGLISKILNDNSIDLIINFAAESHVDRSIDDPKSFLTTNILGTYELLNASLRFYQNGNSIKFIHISTDEVYGSLDKDDLSFTEENRYLPNSPYSASKASSDLLVRSWFHTYGLPSIITNCSNNYGPYQYPEKLIPLVINNAIRYKPITIYGDGSNIRDWLHVKDHCSAILKIAQNGEIGETYNIGGNNEYTNLYIVNKICDILDEIKPIKSESNNNSSYKDLIVNTKDRLGHDFRYSINSSKLVKNLKWSPKIDFHNGIKDTITWYLANQDWVDSIYKKR